MEPEGSLLIVVSNYSRCVSRVLLW